METQNKPMVITVYLSKGGVGKSTLVALLAWFLAGIGYRVVVIDLDRQGSQSTVFDLVDEAGRTGEILHKVITREIDILPAMTPVPEIPALPGHEPGALWVVQGGPQTPDVIAAIATRPAQYRITNTLRVVDAPIRQLAGYADFVLIDMGPSDQITALAGLMATDWLIIPTTTEFLSVQRIASVLDEVDVVQQDTPIQVLGILPMMSRYYFGGLRKSQTAQVGEQFLHANFNDLLLREGRHSIDLPYHEEINKAMWAGVPLLSEQISAGVRGDMLKVLHVIAAKIGIERRVAYA